MERVPGQPSLRLVRPEGDAPGRAAAVGGAGREQRVSDRGLGTRVPGRSVLTAAREGGAMRVATGDERAAVERENVSAASLPALDPRWIMAVQVTREMQGGRAAIVTPEGRKRLMLVGRRLGLRAFDTSLVIAIVQDGARRGEDPLGREANSRLRLVAAEPEIADARPGLSWAQVAVVVVAAGVFGAAVAVMMMRVVGG